MGRSLEPALQAVFPHHMMESVLEQADVLAVAHCSCRVAYALGGRGCDHSTEVCMKFNDMARYVIDRSFGREITQKEALEIIKMTEEAGLVHFVDNADGDIQHNCNCCGCACWNVGSIRRRKIPRDVLMAVYFVRETDEEECTGCGTCVEACPVEALKMEGDFPVVDHEWCIGCGVCSTVCPSDAIKMVLRPDRTAQLPAANFKDLHEKAQKAIYTGGPAFMNVLAPCPRGWRYEASDIMKMCKLALDTCFWPMFEVENGEYKLSYEPKTKLPIEDFLKPQGRFKHLFNKGNDNLIEQLQNEVDKRREKLLKKCK